MRCVAVICALLAVGLAVPAVAQVYPYSATIAVPGLISPAPATPESEPQALAYDTNANRLLIAEGPNHIVQILSGASFAPVATIGEAAVPGGDAGHLNTPSGVAFDPAHNRILVADTGNQRVEIFDAASLSLIATLGQSDVAGSDGGHFSAPAGVVVDPATNRILVADTGNDRVQIFNAASFALVATLGQTGTVGTDNWHFSAPQSVAIDPVSGRILVADTGNARIQLFDAATLTYQATIGQVGAVWGLAIDAAGRNLFAADAGDNDVFVIQADSLATTSYLGLIDSFGPDNARFMTPSGVAFDPATGRIFAGDAFLNRIQVFGAPSWLSAAVAPNGRAVPVGQSSSIFATMINTSATDFANCQIALPSDAPPGLVLGFQTTNPANNLANGQPNTPVTIPAGKSQSFIVTLTAAIPISDPGQSFLFTCDGSTPAPIYAGINTADLTFAAGATADVIVAAETPQEGGLIIVPGSGSSQSTAPTTAFAVAAFNFGSSENLSVSVDSGSFYPVTDDGTAPGYYQTLPLKVLICETNLLTGQCLAAPSATVPVSFPAGSTATFSVYLSSTGAQIPLTLSEARLYLRFTQNVGGAVPDTVGATSVAVTTQAPATAH
jgi:DNA-binding beta-propeller fold protein YncE